MQNRRDGDKFNGCTRWRIVFSHPQKNKKQFAGSMVSEPATTIPFSPENTVQEAAA